ncbi:type III pantothenate kinase [Marinobacter mobilis]|uniref:Type III pantothenate kinase n=1 Tax=Marinobacter mobilis TaxID=488533 RepID=A0A1H3EAZ4_9GAMM|nr:type III pantothenate kinase [Marinobacter mobilis]SDX75770.1 type III pantothenate kinase [Marinobacter mobilis]
MILLVDMGNTRVKWRLQSGHGVMASGVGRLGEAGLFAGLAPFVAQVEAVAVSTVASEPFREELAAAIAARVAAPVTFYWSEARRKGLRNAYKDPLKMGADRWHAMVGAWQRNPKGCLVVDAGSAITVDFIAPDGAHLGGYILAGRGMMLRGLAQDAARIDYHTADSHSLAPGINTSECVFHGLQWYWRALAERINLEAGEWGLATTYVTGGDGSELLVHGLTGEYCPDLVLEGVAAIAAEGCDV